MKEAMRTLVARYVALRADDVDTDQIIPARFLTTTERTGLGAHLFADWQRRADGTRESTFALNQPGAEGAQILVAGRNFGCGSSREHAVWALAGAGFRAVISSSFADIFRGNALGNGLLPVQVDAAVADELLASGSGELRIDVADQVVMRDDRVIARFPIDPFAKHCLMHGVDELQFLLNMSAQIAEYEAREVRPSEAVAVS
jgi:3-isopropylmalate/(R)-2-methylmalate dehydratase small subunit